MKKKIVEKFNLHFFLSLLQLQLPSARLSRSNNSVSLKSNPHGRELISNLIDKNKNKIIKYN